MSEPTTREQKQAVKKRGENAVREGLKDVTARNNFLFHLF
jgi:hypothetical protein